MLKVIGCDVGGTFTDLICLDQVSGEIRLAKVPTTVRNQAEGVLEAIEQTGQDPAARRGRIRRPATRPSAGRRGKRRWRWPRTASS